MDSGQRSPVAVSAESSATDKRFCSRQQLAWSLFAVISLLSTWYFAVAIASVGLGPNKPSVEPGLYPEWYGSRQVLFHGRDPYGPEITREIQLQIYGSAERQGQQRNEHRFAYPLFFVFLFSPLALLPFQVAQAVVLVFCWILTALSVLWWLPRASVGVTRLTYLLFAFASYPAVLGLQLRQPSLVIASLLAAVVFCIRRKWLVVAGILAAMCTSKPQLAIAVLLPLTIWSLAAWRARKAFVIALAISELCLLAASQWLLKGWFFQWLLTLRAYPHYAGSKPLLFDLLRGHFTLVASAVLVGSVLVVSFKLSDVDLWFAVSFSIAVFQLLFPFQIYNEVLLISVALWMAVNRTSINARGQLHTLLFSCTWIILGAGWIAALALSISNIVAPGSALRLWDLPLMACWLYPFAAFAALAVYAGLEFMDLRRSSIGSIAPS
jgi:hypothetical protein